MITISQFMHRRAAQAQACARHKALHQHVSLHNDGGQSMGALRGRVHCAVLVGSPYDAGSELWILNSSPLQGALRAAQRI